MSLKIKHKKYLEKTLPTFRKAVQLFVESPQASGLDCRNKSDDLTCACAITTHALARLIKIKNLGEPTICLGHFGKVNKKTKIDSRDINHCWLEFGGYIIDLTATQFNGEVKEKIPEIIFKKIEGSGNRFLPLIKTTFDDIKKDVTDWPRTQQPSLRYSKHILRNFQDISGENLGL